MAEIARALAARTGLGAAMKAGHARSVAFTTPPQCAGLSDNEILVLKTKLFLSG